MQNRVFLRGTLSHEKSPNIESLLATRLKQILPSRFGVDNADQDVRSWEWAIIAEKVSAEN